MQIVNKKLSLSQFKDYVSKKYFGTLPATKLVIHHTWKPTKAQWTGQGSVNGLKGYYERKGWSAGPHLFIADDGIWLFTDMKKDGIHAGAGNHRSVGIEVVGNYDNKKWTGKTYDNTIGAIKALMKRLKIKENNVKFHRDYSSKSCPGWSITKDWLFKQLKQPMSEDDFLVNENEFKFLKWAKKEIYDWKDRMTSTERKKVVAKIEDWKEGDDVRDSFVQRIQEYDEAVSRLEKKVQTRNSECERLTSKFVDFEARIKELEEKNFLLKKENDALHALKEQNYKALGILQKLQEAFKMLLSFK